MADSLTNNEIDGFQRAVDIERIFWPYGRSQRSEFYRNPTVDANPFARFVHYTSADAALHIIQSKSIWMRNATCMADFREVHHGFELINDFLKSEGKSQLETCLDIRQPGAVSEAINLFNSWWTDIRFNTFITSVSEHNDAEDKIGRLSMWRSFGGNFARVAMVLRIPWRMESRHQLNLHFAPVAYLNKDSAITEFRNVIEAVKLNQTFIQGLTRSELIRAIYHFFLNSSLCIKHAGFKEEREWRIVYGPNRQNSTYLKSSIETVQGVPQRVYKIPLDANIIPEISITNLFDSLIIGPSPYPWAMYDSFVNVLQDAGVPDPANKVFTSDIPIRA